MANRHISQREPRKVAPAPETEGTLRFHIELKIPFSEMAQWPVQRIKQFFEGLAKMLDAREGRY